MLLPGIDTAETQIQEIADNNFSTICLLILSSKIFPCI